MKPKWFWFGWLAAVAVTLLNGLIGHWQANDTWFLSFSVVSGLIIAGIFIWERIWLRQLARLSAPEREARLRALSEARQLRTRELLRRIYHVA